MLKTVPCNVCSILYRIKVMPCCPGPWIRDTFKVNHRFLPALVIPIICGSVGHVQTFILAMNQHMKRSCNLVCKCRWKVLHITPRDLDKCLDWYETKFFIYVLDIFLNPFKMRKLWCKVWNAFHLDLLNDFLSTFKDI